MSFSSRWTLTRQWPPLSRRWQGILSGSLLLALLALLWVEIGARENLGDIWNTFRRQMGAANWLWLLLALLLMPLNWLAETWKWHRMLRRLQPIALWRSLMAVWVGVSFSLLTPNRVGEYGGRILFVRPRHRWQAAAINLVGNFSQLLVLLTAGIAGGLYLTGRYWHTDPLWQEMAMGGALALVSALFLLYIHLNRLPALLSRLPWLKRQAYLLRQAQVLQLFNTPELWSLLRWAVLRYAIYSTQYFLLLFFFGINPGILMGYAGIATIFLAQTSLPLPPLTALVARGNLAVQIWLPIGANALGSLAATFSLWIINLILPALIGTFFLLYVNITKSPGYEDD